MYSLFFKEWLLTSVDISFVAVLLNVDNRASMAGAQSILSGQSITVLSTLKLMTLIQQMVCKF
jgi:hypothetical protein